MIGGGCGGNGAVNDSSPRDNLSISAPNACNAVIVDGVGSGILSKTEEKKSMVDEFLFLLET